MRSTPTLPALVEEMPAHEASRFNIFQNTPNYTLKALGSSKPGDYIEFEAQKDIICAASCCPYDLDGVNGGKITDVAVVTGIWPERVKGDSS